VQIAAASGHQLAADIIDLNVDSTHKMPAYKTSMLIDFENGREMETEAILGNAVRVADRLEMAIPYLKSLYALMKLREAALLAD
jgi:2-dehydropantoate 2-reductase